MIGSWNRDRGTLFETVFFSLHRLGLFPHSWNRWRNVALYQVPSDTASAMSSMIVQHSNWSFTSVYVGQFIYFTKVARHSSCCVDRNKVFTGMPHDAAQVEREHGMLLPKSFFNNLVSIPGSGLTSTSNQSSPKETQLKWERIQSKPQSCMQYPIQSSPLPCKSSPVHSSKYRLPWALHQRASSRCSVRPRSCDSPCAADGRATTDGRPAAHPSSAAPSVRLLLRRTPQSRRAADRPRTFLLAGLPARRALSLCSYRAAQESVPDGH